MSFHLGPWASLYRSWERARDASDFLQADMIHEMLQPPESSLFSSSRHVILLTIEPGWHRQQQKRLSSRLPKRPLIKHSLRRQCASVALPAKSRAVQHRTKKDAPSAPLLAVRWFFPTHAPLTASRRAHIVNAPADLTSRPTLLF